MLQLCTYGATLDAACNALKGVVVAIAEQARCACGKGIPLAKVHSSMASNMRLCQLGFVCLRVSFSCGMLAAYADGDRRLATSVEQAAGYSDIAQRWRSTTWHNIYRRVGPGIVTWYSQLRQWKVRQMCCVVHPWTAFICRCNGDRVGSRAACTLCQRTRWCHTMTCAKLLQM